MKKIIGLLVVLGAASTAFACSSSDDDHAHSSSGGHTSEFPSCEVIVEACHPLDMGEGPIHDCHELAHEATSDEPCAAQKDACLATCVASPDGGSADAAAE